MAVSLPFPPTFAIGPVKISPATVLAPMAGVTDTVFRRLIRDQGGCGLMMTEFTSSHGVVGTNGGRSLSRNALRFKYLSFAPEEHPISAQLFGADPVVMAEAARICQDMGFDAVDINFGCPVKKVVRNNGVGLPAQPYAGAPAGSGLPTGPVHPSNHEIPCRLE